MVLGFLAVEGKRNVQAVFGQHHRRGAGQGDALVGRAKQHVELDAAGADGLGVKARQLQQAGAVVEQAGVEEVRRQPACLGDEFTKTQHLLIHGKTNKILAKIAHRASFNF